MRCCCAVQCTLSFILAVVLVACFTREGSTDHQTSCCCAVQGPLCFVLTVVLVTYFRACLLTLLVKASLTIRPRVLRRFTAMQVDSVFASFVIGKQ